MKKKYYTNMVRTYFAIICLFLTVLLIGYYVINTIYVSDRINSANESLIYNVQNTCDSEIRATNSIKRGLLKNEEIIRYIGGAKTNFYQRTIAAQELSSATINSSWTGAKYAIAVEGDDVVLYNGITLGKSSFYKELGIELQVQGCMEYLRKMNNEFVEYVINMSDQLILVSRENIENTESFAFTVIEKKMLFNGMEPCFIVQYDERSGFEFSENKGLYDFLRNKDRNETCANKEIDGSKYYVLDSALYNFSYVYDSDANLISRRKLSTLIHTLILILVFGLIALGCIVFFTRRLYQPIERIVSLLAQEEQLEFGGKDEIEYIQSNVHKMRDENKALVNLIDSKLETLRNKFIIDLIYNLVDLDDIEQDLKLYGLGWVLCPFYLILVEIVNYEEIRTLSGKKNVVNIESYIMSLLDEHIKSDNRTESMLLKYDRILVICEENDIEEMKRKIAEFLGLIDNAFSIELTVCISNLCERIEDIRMTYLETENILEHRFAKRKKSIYCAWEEEEENINDIYYTLDMEREIIAAVDSKNKKHALGLLINAVDENLTKRKLCSDSASHFIFAIANTINRIIQKNSINIDRIAYLELRMASDINELKKNLEILINDIFVNIEQNEGDISDKTKQEFISYIEQNYNKDISLQDMGTHFYLTSTYVSALFKNATGENFKDYLNSYRVKQACRILDENPLVKLKDLADMVGLNSVNTLLRIFKKYTGQSPKQYINIKRNVLD